MSAPSQNATESVGGDGANNPTSNASGSQDKEPSPSSSSQVSLTSN